MCHVYIVLKCACIVVNSTYYRVAISCWKIWKLGLVGEFVNGQEKLGRNKKSYGRIVEASWDFSCQGIVIFNFPSNFSVIVLPNFSFCNQSFDGPIRNSVCSTHWGELQAQFV